MTGKGPAKAGHYRSQRSVPRRDGVSRSEPFESARRGSRKTARSEALRGGLIEGHTDAQGADAFNLRLSKRRADAVMKYLIDNGVPSSRLTSEGFGETQPVADNNTAEGRALNRRVVLRRAN